MTLALIGYGLFGAAVYAVCYLIHGQSASPSASAAPATTAVSAVVGTLEDLMLGKLQAALGTAAHAILDSVTQTVLAPALAAHTPAAAVAAPAPAAH